MFCVVDYANPKFAFAGDRPWRDLQSTLIWNAGGKPPAFAFYPFCIYPWRGCFANANFSFLCADSCQPHSMKTTGCFFILCGVFRQNRPFCPHSMKEWAVFSIPRGSTWRRSGRNQKKLSPGGAAGGSGNGPPRSAEDNFRPRPAVCRKPCRAAAPMSLRPKCSTSVTNPFVFVLLAQN